MALSWTEIFPDVDGDPVRASLDEVGDVATMFERMGDASRAHPRRVRAGDVGVRDGLAGG